MVLGILTPNLDIQDLDRWNSDAHCCTDDEGDGLHIGGTIGDCNSHCVSLSIDDMVLTVEIKNESASSNVYSVTLEPWDGEDRPVEIEPPKYDCKPIPYDESEQFKFRISSDTGGQGGTVEGDHQHGSINFRIILKYNIDERAYSHNKIETDLQLNPSVNV